MSRKLFFTIAVLLFMLIPVSVNAAPQIPVRIGGIITIDGIQLTRMTDAGYSFVVTRQNGTSFSPYAEDSDGLNSASFYLIDIPVYDADNQPEGAKPGNTDVIHVYKDGNEVALTSPPNGEFTVGNCGTTTQIDLVIGKFIPARIEGTITVDGKSLTQATDTGYTLVVTRRDGTSYVPSAEDMDGVNGSDSYLIDIPLYDAVNQPEGARPGNIAKIHVYKDGREISLTAPANGEFSIGSSGSTTQMDIVLRGDAVQSGGGIQSTLSLLLE